MAWTDGMEKYRELGLPRADVVNIFIAINVPHARSFDMIEDDGVPSYTGKGTYGGIDSTRHKMLAGLFH